MIIQAISSGHTSLQVKAIQLAPDIFYGWILPYLYLSLIVAAATATWYWFGRREADLPLAFPASRRLYTLPAGLGWGLIVAVVVVASGYFIFQQERETRTYAAAELEHFVGRPVSDPKAEDGRAWLVDPMLDPPQKAVYGPFEIYEAGRYRVAFRIKLPQAVEGDPEIARLQVSATANFNDLRTQPLRVGNFSQPDVYHDFVLTVENPRQQALSFDVHYLGLAALAIDQITVTKISR